MKAIPIEEFVTINPIVHDAAARLGCTEVRLSAPIWRGPAGDGPAGEQIRIAEYSWWRALLLEDSVVLEEDEPQKFHGLLAEYGLGEDESVSPSESHPIRPEAPAPSMAPTVRISAPERVPITAYVQEATKLKMEQQANQAGLSLGALLDRLFAGELSENS